MNTISVLPLIQNELGEILLIMSETRNKAREWLYENHIHSQESIEGVYDDTTFGQSIDNISEKRSLKLDVRYSILIFFKSKNRDRMWWEMHCCFYLGGLQTCTAKLYIEAREIDLYGPVELDTIFTGEIPNGKEGVQKIQGICKLTFEHMTNLLSKQTATEIYRHHIQSKTDEIHSA